mmetsp:Transcript_27575/g.89811  ORF Transcript_27575/g.89811 Transcript_27575/m.89811 type:complete len:155 (-) Transcript_27575:357-821(-)
MSRLGIRRRNQDMVLETARAQESRVDDVGTRRSAKENNRVILAGLHAVHLDEQLRQHAIQHPIRRVGVAARGSDCVNLIYEEDARSTTSRLPLVNNEQYNLMLAWSNSREIARSLLPTIELIRSVPRTCRKLATGAASMARAIAAAVFPVPGGP